LIRTVRRVVETGNAFVLLPRVAVQAATDVKVLTISTPHNIVGRRNKKIYEIKRPFLNLSDSNAR
jgi:hypothetical protein